MNDVSQWIDSKEELKTIMRQIGDEYPEGHRIRKMTEKIIKQYRSSVYLMSFRISGGTFDQDLMKTPYPLSHEAKILNQSCAYLHYRLMKFYNMAKTPAVIKGLIDILLRSARDSAKKVFQHTKETHSKLDIERDPNTGKTRAKQHDSGAEPIGALINVKAQPPE